MNKLPVEHRRQRWWQILAPLLGLLLLALGLVVLTLRAEAVTVAHASAMLVACVAGVLLVLGLPVLALLVWAIWAWPRAYRAVPRQSARVQAELTRFRRVVTAWSDKAARPIIVARVYGAYLRAAGQALRRRVTRGHIQRGAP